jgi:hypothetical protein
MKDIIRRYSLGGWLMFRTPGEFASRLAHERDTPIWRAISATLSPPMRLATTM